MGRLWTPEEMDYLRENLGKTDLRTIMKKINRTACAIQCKALEIGISYKIPRSDPALRKSIKSNNSVKKSTYQRRREQGLCTRCGKRWAEAGRTKCRPCRERDQACYRANHMTEYLREYKSRQKAERRANHQCFNCGSKLPAGATGQCEKCRKKQRERTNMYRLRMRIHGIPRSDRRRDNG